MKAQMSETAALLNATKSVLGLAKSSEAGGRISKNSKSTSPLSASSVTEEMQVYFSKLKELVPFMPRNRKLSKLEIIQYVIDYICDLQLALEAHPAAASANHRHHHHNHRAGVAGLSPPSLAACCCSSAAACNRQPLGVIANVPSNTTLPNTCAAQEANHDKLPSHLEEVNTRPVSC